MEMFLNLTNRHRRKMSRHKVKSSGCISSQGIVYIKLINSFQFSILVSFWKHQLIKSKWCIELRSLVQVVLLSNILIYKSFLKNYRRDALDTKALW